MALTDTEVHKSKPADRPYRLSDAGSLDLWVTPSGGKLWRWAYTFGGKEKLMSFGKYPDVPLALARERHAEARKLLATGVDPMAERKAVKTAEKVAEGNSFQSIANLWIDHWQHGKRTGVGENPIYDLAFSDPLEGLPTCRQAYVALLWRDDDK